MSFFIYILCFVSLQAFDEDERVSVISSKSRAQGRFAPQEAPERVDPKRFKSARVDETPRDQPAYFSPFRQWLAAQPAEALQKYTEPLSQREWTETQEGAARERLERQRGYAESGI